MNVYVEPMAQVDFFSQIIGSSAGGWESEIDPDNDVMAGN